MPRPCGLCLIELSQIQAIAIVADTNERNLMNDDTQKISESNDQSGPKPDAETKEITKGKASETGGPKGPEPTRYGDWEKKGRCIDF